MNIKNLLFIDNDVYWAQQLKSTCCRNDIKLDFIPSMLEAMQIITSGSNLYNCILINYSNINQNADIDTLVTNIKAKAPFVKIIFTLDNNDPYKIVEISKSQSNSFLIKPYTIEDILIEIEKKGSFYKPNFSFKNNVNEVKINGLSDIGIPNSNINNLDTSIGRNDNMNNFNGSNTTGGMDGQMPPQNNGYNGSNLNNQMPPQSRGYNPNGMNGQIPPQGNKQAPQQGMGYNPNIPPQGGYNPNGMNSQMPPQGGYNPNNPNGMNGQMPPQGGYNPNNPNGMNGQMPPQGMGYNPNVPPQGRGYNPNGQMPPQGMGQNPNMPPQGGYNPNGMNSQMPPQGGYNPNNPNGMNNQMPPQGGYNPNNPNGMNNQMPPQGMGYNPNGVNEQMPPQGMGYNPNMPPQGRGQQGVVRIPSNTTIAVHCPKGGVGKSSISKELAIIYALSQVNGEKLKVCLVDMDIDYGDIAVMLELKQVKSISDWARNIRQRMSQYGESEVQYSYDEVDRFYLLTHKSGLKVLAAPTNHRDSAMINEQMVKIIINNLKSMFDVVIIDTGNNVKDFTVTSMELADRLLMIGNTEVPTINELLTLHKTLGQIQFPSSKIALLMNEIKNGEEEQAQQIATYLGLPLIGKLPKIGAIEQANNNGDAICMGPDNPFTIELKRVANTILPVVKKPNMSKGRGPSNSKQGKKESIFSKIFKK